MNAKVMLLEFPFLEKMVAEEKEVAVAEVEILNGLYSDGRVFRMKCTRKDSDISTSSFLSRVEISRICIMYSRTPFTLVSQRKENFMIRVFAKVLSEVMNWSSIALK
ncbi:uncharacterized protein [Glycine max]|uniref:uncharacterized protein isoform X2 n=1 Tax=Glycine max TaxID=3847 RepID=UPI001B358164|nr:uncharacterized protein LOC121174944 isoform X2 [Glycine max]